MLIRKLALMAAVAGGLALSSQAAQAQVVPVVAGGFLGGLAGSVYATGLQATAAAVGSAATSTVTAVAGVIPATATAVSGAIAAASAPVIVGVAAGGALGYLLLRNAQ